MLQLLFHCDDRAPLGQADPEQPCQLRDHKDRLVIPLTLHHPGDGLQCIVKKMRIDLALQRVQLTLSPLILLQNDLFHQRINLLIGTLDGISKMPDLQRPSDINLRLFPRFIFQD